ncbi:MAG: 1-acyl-sn-glycerol-3-phosphate acyltransferase [Proteobacteria bacterium]|nr:1-acyl-sn-glycerol-3-phosphate acyltransferase [Pseudomonadota bacterium]MBU1581704.1 1-acyl-sn-glycerol-3-phosphate acyltransferase [Pseudomonadota bacterium]MBU2455445.1 1-acyl-sn-glycerol-3-phosphate acyltransferase [Pseudomonadota bacterium]MBU2630007.1 1-acyl-sn-glycerol-3-phosphate acyltransferase [Pseudomonadota bacterium]
MANMHLSNLSKKRLNKKVTPYAHILLMNCIAIPLILLWTAVGMALFPFAFLFMKFILGDSTTYLTRQCIWIYARVCQFLLSPFVVFTPPQLHGGRLKTPGIFVVNHRSFFDTYCINMVRVSDICCAVRAWPFNIPFYNIFMKLAGYLDIESFPWDKTLEISKKNIKNNSSILFFPEGHRSKDKNLLHFYSGAFKLAIENNVPVIPVCLTGTQILLPPNRYFLAPARIKMKILDPVFPDQFQGEMKHIALKNHVKNLMKQSIKQMDEETI